MYLLDTNICIALMKKNAKAIAEFAIKGSDRYVSTITLGELSSKSDRCQNPLLL